MRAETQRLDAGDPSDRLLPETRSASGDRPLQRADGGRVTRERAVGERVDLVERQLRHRPRLRGPERLRYRQRKPLPLPPLIPLVVLLVYAVLWRQTVTTWFQPLQALKPWAAFG